MPLGMWAVLKGGCLSREETGKEGKYSFLKKCEEE